MPLIQRAKNPCRGKHGIECFQGSWEMTSASGAWYVVVTMLNLLRGEYGRHGTNGLLPGRWQAWAAQVEAVWLRVCVKPLGPEASPVWLRRVTWLVCGWLEMMGQKWEARSWRGVCGNKEFGLQLVLWAMECQQRAFHQLHNHAFSLWWCFW